jgi:hypothetical protein
MTVAVRDLDTLDAANVAQCLAEVSVRIQEQDPKRDSRREHRVEADPTLWGPSSVDDGLASRTWSGRLATGRAMADDTRGGPNANLIGARPGRCCPTPAPATAKGKRASGPGERRR